MYHLPFTRAVFRRFRCSLHRFLAYKTISRGQHLPPTEGLLKPTHQTPRYAAEPSVACRPCGPLLSPPPYFFSPPCVPITLSVEASACTAPTRSMEAGILRAPQVGRRSAEFDAVEGMLLTYCDRGAFRLLFRRSMLYCVFPIECGSHF